MFRRVWIGVLVCAGVFLLHFLPAHEVWLDETHSWYFSTLSFVEMIRHVAGDVHPPLHFIATWLSVTLFGDSAVALRLPSALAFLGAGVAFYALCREVTGDEWMGVLGMLLFLTSPALFWYGSEARMYSFLVLFLVLALLTLWRTLSGSDESRTLRAVIFGVMCALAYYSHYLAVFLVTGLFLVYLGFLSRDIGIRRCLNYVSVSAATVLVLTAPWYPVMFEQRQVRLDVHDALVESRDDPATLGFLPSQEEGSEGSAERAEIPGSDEPGLRDVVVNLASVAGAYPVSNPFFLLVLGLPVILVGIGGAVLLARGDAVAVMAASVAAMNLIAVPLLDVFDRRYLIGLAPLFILVAIRFLSWLRSTEKARRLAAAVGGALAIVYIAGMARVVTADYPFPSRDLVGTLESQYEDGDLVVFSSLYGQVLFDYHAGREDFEGRRTGFPLEVYDWWDAQAFQGWGGPVIQREQLADYVRRLEEDLSGQTLWLVQFETGYYDPRNQLAAALEESARSSRAVSGSDLDALYQVRAFEM